MAMDFLGVATAAKALVGTVGLVGLLWLGYELYTRWEDGRIREEDQDNRGRAFRRDGGNQVNVNVVNVNV